MLITTTKSLDSGAGAIVSQSWPGPRTLIVLPGSGLSRRQIDVLMQDQIVVEYLQAPVNTAALLSDLCKLLRPLIAKAAWPWLYLNRSPDARTVSQHLAAGRADPYAIHAEMNENGHIGLLRLGEMIGTNPLLPGFFDVLRDRVVDDPALLDMLRATFDWTVAL